jgi:hypothetical protein
MFPQLDTAGSERVVIDVDALFSGFSDFSRIAVDVALANEGTAFAAIPTRDAAAFLIKFLLVDSVGVMLAHSSAFVLSIWFSSSIMFRNKCC